jgi:mannose-1-phosphate guanylyltransferase
MNYYAVIMAGGGGTRLWPLSRRSHPKQLLTIFGNQSLYQMAVARLTGLIENQKILVVTTRDQYEVLLPSTPQLLPSQFLLEPEPRGTASVIGLAATVLSLDDPHTVMAVLTSDHLIQNVTLFQSLMRNAYEVAQTGMLVTLGIKPEYPSTGYGYIEVGEKIDSTDQTPARKVIRFVEKPDTRTAESMLATGKFLWNSGMFFWRVDAILREFEVQMPALYEALMEIKAAWSTSDQDATLQRIWPTIQPETIDYGIMEKASQLAVIPAEGLGWNDVGSWNSLPDVMQANKDGNIILSKSLVSLDTSSSIIYEYNPEKLVALKGLNDMIIIDTDDALLICPRDEAQHIREIVAEIKNRRMDQYL